MVIRFSSVQSCHGFLWGMIASVSLTIPVSAASQDIDVLIDQAELVALESPASQVVVGNPSIADVTVQNGKTLVITGKSFGQTNLIVIDAAGKVILNRRLMVQEPNPGVVTVYKGSARFTFHCAPNCETPLAIGDSNDYFDSIAKEVRTKQSIGQASAEGQSQSE